MKLRVILTALIIALTGLVAPVTFASSASASVHHASSARHACTRKPNGKCIKRGQKCAQAKRGQVGWGASGAKLKCKGKHPHWRRVQAASSGGGGGSCTTTSSGSCIQGGEFCPQSKYGEVGYDANGTAYTCEGDHTHPHWE
jgi:hypothetical protein